MHRGVSAVTGARPWAGAAECPWSRGCGECGCAINAEHQAGEQGEEQGGLQGSTMSARVPEYL